MDKDVLYSNEDEIIEKADAILADESCRDNSLLKEFSILLKDYKKLYKQNRFLTKRGDRQELKMRQINDELLQTNELLKSVMTKGMLQVREYLLAQVMNLTGELVLTRNQLVGAARDETWHNQKIEGFFQNLDRVTSSLQERIMQTRMQPLGNVLATLPRIITEESQRLKKLIRLEIEGSEVELDKSILESLADILARLIRNACEHGIETPSERSKCGKPETGNIKVRAFRETGNINIIVRDDGAGIDRTLIKKKALTEGLCTRDELARMSEKELMSLFMSCFSAAESIKSATEEQGGSAEISSEPGAGTEVYLKLPLTLSIIPCLIVEVGKERYAIPKISVEELVCLYDEDAADGIVYAGSAASGSAAPQCGTQEVCRLRDRLLPVVRMKEVLEDIRTSSLVPKPRLGNGRIAEDVPKQGLGNKRNCRVLLFAVVKSRNRRFGLVIDRVTGSEEIVVNPMHPKLKSLGIYSGTTVMGDGTVALILDIQGIADHAGVESVSENEVTVTRYVSESAGSDVQRVLLFKVGEHEQFAVPLLLIRRVKEIFTDRIAAVGSRFYITVDGIPTLILRLDRLLDVSALPEKKTMYLLIPRYAPCPFGILMSHIGNVVSVPLILDTDSLREEGLMGTAVVQDRLTLFPDIWYLLEKAAPDRPEKQKTDISSEKPVCILLVEDSAFFRQLVKRWLESGNRKVITAENGLKALELMDKTAFDLIVSDIEMPEMDGRTFIRQVRMQEKYRHIPALALTALDFEESRFLGKDAGFDAYQKKIDRERLIWCVENLLKKRSEV